MARKAITKKDATSKKGSFATARQNKAAVEVAKATTALKAGEPNSLTRVSRARSERRAAKAEAQNTDSNNK